jgi:hypothetical protein
VSDLAPRGNPGWFKPGTTGNAGGRPKLPPEIRDACRAATPDVIKAWKAEVKTKGPDWVAASKLLMAYGWGSPTATVEISRPDEPERPRAFTIDPKKLSREELEAFSVIQKAHARLKAQAEGPPAVDALTG